MITLQPTDVRILTVDDVAALSGYPRSSVYRWAREYFDRPEAKRQGPRPRRDPHRPWKREFNAADVQEWMNRSAELTAEDEAA